MVSMALHSFACLGSKSNQDHARRQEIFDIDFLFCETHDDIDMVMKSPVTAPRFCSFGWNLESF